MREMYAFWKYDLFPYMLYGRITKFLDNGRVLVKGYGNYSFLPMVVMDGAKGRIAVEKIDALRAAHYDKGQVFMAWKKEHRLVALKAIGLTTTRTRLQ